MNEDEADLTAFAPPRLGRAPTVAADPCGPRPPRTSQSIASARDRPAQKSTSAGVPPKPARQNRR